MIPIADYMTAESKLPPYLPYPRFLLKMEITHTAKLLYALLLDRATLSQKNGWTDGDGRVYIIFPVAEIASTLDKSSMTIQSALNELDAAGLVERKRQGFSAPNHLYVKMPPVVKISLPVDYEKLYIIPQENFTTDIKKTLGMTSRKLYTNNLSNNNMSNNDLTGASEARTAFGRYENVFLSDTELAGLKAEFPGKWEYYIDRLSCHIASTGKDYQSHAATIYKWAQEDAAKQPPKQGIPDYTYKEGQTL